MSDPIDPGEGYRLLHKGEEIRTGDQFYRMPYGWRDVISVAGQTYGSVEHYPIRRRLQDDPLPVEPSELDTLREQVAALTAERDDLRADAERWIDVGFGLSCEGFNGEYNRGDVAFREYEPYLQARSAAIDAARKENDMSEPTYRIKPLEWEQFGTAFRTMTVVGRYLCGAGYFYAPDNDYASLKDLSPEAAKAAAEAHYRELLMAALEEVK